MLKRKSLWRMKSVPREVFWYTDVVETAKRKEINGEKRGKKGEGREVLWGGERKRLCWKKEEERGLHCWGKERERGRGHMGKSGEEGLCFKKWEDRAGGGRGGDGKKSCVLGRRGRSVWGKSVWGRGVWVCVF